MKCKKAGEKRGGLEIGKVEGRNTKYILEIKIEKGCVCSVGVDEGRDEAREMEKLKKAMARRERGRHRGTGREGERVKRRRGWQRGWTRATNQRGYRWWWIVRQSRRPAAGVDAGDSSGSCGQSEGIVAMATGACVHRLAYRRSVHKRTREPCAHMQAPLYVFKYITRARVFVHLWNVQISNTYGRIDVCARIFECAYIHLYR